MYPTISFFIQDIFGINIPLPIQTFGFFMALAFLIAAYVLTQNIQFLWDNKRLLPILITEKKDNENSTKRIIISILWAFIIGYKCGDALLNYTEFSSNPQQFILNLQGNIGTGIALVVLMLVYKYFFNTQLGTSTQTQRLMTSSELVSEITIRAAIFGILGAKLMDNLEHIDDLINDPISALFSFSGLTFYGGLILGSLMILHYLYKKKIPIWSIIDCFAPILMLAYGIGRLGCHLSGDGDWGIVNTFIKPFNFLPNWLWSYNYPHNVLNEGVTILNCMGKYCYELPEGVFPTSLYECIAALLLFAILQYLFRTKHWKTGIIFGIYLIFCGCERLIIEFIRVNVRYYNFSQAQWIALGLIVLGSYILLIRNINIKAIFRN